MICGAFDIRLYRGRYFLYPLYYRAGLRVSISFRAPTPLSRARRLYINQVYSNLLSPSERGIAMVFQNYALFPSAACLFTLLTAWAAISLSISVSFLRSSLFSKFWRVYRFCRAVGLRQVHYAENDLRA